MGLSNFVSTLGLEPEPFHKTVVSHRSSVIGKSLRPPAEISRRQTHLTGTFNLFVKDRIAFPPERRAFSPAGKHTEANPAVLETFRNYRLRRTTVNPKESH